MSDGDCPTASSYSFCCGARPSSQDGAKLIIQGIGPNVETIDLPRRAGSRPPAPRPMALDRAMNTVLAHEECWNDWLNISEPAAARAKNSGYAAAGRDPPPSPSPGELQTPSGQVPASASDAEYAKPEQTVIVLDWDDTLFPSNWLQQSEGFFKPLSETHAKSFLKLGECLEAFLKLAMTLGRVIIVTNSSEPWVSISVRTFMPFLEPLIKDIKVIYARALFERVDSSSSGLVGAIGAYKARLAMQADVLAPQKWKEKAFECELGAFYSRYEGQSWKNVISIGDSIYEREAAKTVVLCLEGPSSNCRLKTVKFLENPHLDDLIAELRVMQNALSLIVQYDGNLDVDLDQNDLKHGLSLSEKILEPQVSGTSGFFGL